MMETNEMYPLTSAVLVPASALSRDRYPPSMLIHVADFLLIADSTMEVRLRITT